jgi:molecular chaperone GrpE
MSEGAKLEGWGAVREDIVGLIRTVDALRTDRAATRAQAAKDQAKLLLDILEVLDGFDRVFANIAPREQAADRQARIWVGNFRSVRRLLVAQLQKHEVVRIEAPDGKAVPGLHVVAETRPHAEREDGTIVEELQAGYLWRGEVLRKSQVIAVKH